MSLVSGRPISFVMDLHQPLSVSRPIVEQELYASLRPQVYGQDVAAIKEKEDRVSSMTDRRCDESLMRLAKHPLIGLRLKNTTKLDLMQEPITVYEAGINAGDARIEGLAPGSERLVSYAVDLDVATLVAKEQQARKSLEEYLLFTRREVIRRALRPAVRLGGGQTRHRRDPVRRGRRGPPRVTAAPFAT